MARISSKIAILSARDTFSHLSCKEHDTNCYDSIFCNNGAAHLVGSKLAKLLLEHRELSGG